MRLSFRFTPQTGGLLPNRSSGQAAAHGAEVWRGARAQGIGRPVPYIPDGNLLPVFFLHIPRCSGASVVTFLRRIYGEDGVTTGAETQVARIMAGHDMPVSTDCVAGSLPLMRWRLYRDTAAYFRVTVLRDPWARLVSHINRLAVLGPEEAGPDGSVARMLAAAVADTDFTSRPSLERLRRRVPLVEGGFDNLQTRMLLTGSMSSMVKPLQPRDVDQAVAELERFAVIGFCEDQTGLQRSLARLTGASVAPEPIFEAGGRPVALTLRNELAREVLEPWFALDRQLYNRARRLSTVSHPS